MPHSREKPHARDAFIESGVLDDSVRDVVGSSWRRSTRAGVDPTLVEPVYASALGETQLHALVSRIMHQMAAALVGEPVSMIFADPSGRVVHRICPDSAFGRRLEAVSLAPGFAYGEDSVGTNGIGTALLERAPTLISGSEHFSEPLMAFACAGAPVHHPISGALVGVLDLTCEATVSNFLLLTYARAIAQRIEDELLAEVSVQEMTLLRDYLAACRHATGPVLAMSENVVMMNHLARQRLDATDRTALVARTDDAIGGLLPQTFVADLPSGTIARLDYRPTSVGSVVVGGVIRVQVQETAARPRLSHSPRRLQSALPGVAGTSPEWARAGAQLRESHRTGTWVMLVGERGVGKHALARAVHVAESPARHLRVLDAAVAGLDPDTWFQQLEDELVPEEGTLVIRHIDQLPASLVESVSSRLLEESGRAHSAPARWVVATRDSTVVDDAVESQLVPCFDRSITVEPLRHRPDDIRAIIPSMLRTLSPTRDLTISARALNQLARHPWPGNAAQLRDVLRRVILTKRSGTIELDDLPPECMAVGRRTLTPLEALERDAITQALHDQGGNKGKAAEHLGVSRATIYRKLRGYDIDTRR